MLETTQLLANTYKAAIDRLVIGLDSQFDHAVDLILASSGQGLYVEWNPVCLARKYHPHWHQQVRQASFCIRLKRYMEI